MKIVKLQGGLGNQLFQYSFGKFLEYKLGEDIFFDISFYKKNKGRKLEIENLIKNKIVKTNLAQKITYKLFNLYYTQENSFSFLEAKNLKQKKYFDGYWQNISFIEPITKELLQEFEIFYLENYKINEDFRNTTSIHIRKTDYVNNDDVSICNEEYFINAINIIKNKTNCSTFLVFSDDIPASKEMFSKNNTNKDNLIFMETTINNPLNDLLLMSQCDNNIISNSTFSWWAAFLNKNLKKIVITPKIWHKKLKNEVNLIPETYIKL